MCTHFLRLAFTSLETKLFRRSALHRIYINAESELRTSLPAKDKMEESKDLVLSQALVKPDFIEELLPSSQRVSLLYHLSYLCSAKFPKCEKLIRAQALETRLLYSSSEATLLKCMGTSQNLVSTLFPRLIFAVEKEKPTMAIQYLEKARKWITDIIQEVEKIVDRYDLHNKDVNSTTSDIITEKRDTEQKAKELNTEIKAMEEALEQLKMNQKTIADSIETLEKQIQSKSSELEKHVREVTSKDKGLGIFAAVVPFIGAIVKSIYDSATGPGVAAKTKALENELNRLNSEKAALKQQEWTLQLKIIDEGMVLAKKKIELGVVPDPVHLGEVQQCLSKIQNILIQLKSFWQTVNSMLGVLKDKTFVDEDLIDDPEVKELFVSSIQEATKVWRSFGCFCGEATNIFKQQIEGAYKFLESDPTSLSKEAWELEYNSVKKQLENVNIVKSVCPPSVSAVPPSLENKTNPAPALKHKRGSRVASSKSKKSK
ncbi:hypothetical protein AMEX_G964 [Astyanax mexicanus]|uniref:Uncharacterized protein n=1 Tax=Astyanax mexicanus TaxID=7994 RepID=A0A8T2MD04_ASTMX|nr:hypothetical protein AMEX_G964 [Astyanax mexicanus]